MLLCITTWSKPYSNNQGQILDILETSLLTARFVLYFMVAMLLILFPSPTTTRMCAYFVLVMLASVFAFALLHIFAQILRQQKHNLAEEEDKEAEVEDSEEIMAKKTTTQRVAGQIQVFKLTIVEKVIPFFQEDDAEKWILSWSPASGVPSRVTASRKSARRTGRQSWAMEDCHAHSPGPGLWSRIRPAVLKARAIFLRFGTSVQRSSVVRAYEEFHSLWLDQLEQNHIPNVGTLCTLVASHQTLPSKGDVGETWINEAKKVLEDSEQKWRLPAHEFTETVHRLRSLPIQQALNLVKAIDRFFAMQDFHTEANARRKSKESNPTLLYIQAKDGGSPEVVETLPYIPTEDGGRHEVVETLPYIPTEEVQEHIGFPLVPGALADQDGHTNQEGFDLLQ